MLKLYIGDRAIGGGGIEVVSSLPTANENEYNKNLLYLMNGNLHYIVYSNGSYSYRKVSNKEQTQSYQVTFTASDSWSSQNSGRVMIYDGQDNTGTLLLDQNPADKSAYPITLTVTSGKTAIYLYSSGYIMNIGVSSDDYSDITYTAVSDGQWIFYVTVDKDGSVDMSIGDFDD